MQSFQRLLHLRPVTAFGQDERGVVAMIFAIMVIVIAAAVGGAVDFARQYHANTVYRDATDGAVLAGARVKQTGGTDAEAIAMAQAFMTNAVSRFGIPATVTFTVSPDGGALVGNATLAVPSTFLRVIGIDELPVRVVNEARFGLGPDVELALMLDVTGSMSGTKITDLKVAVEELINVMIPDTTSPNDAVRRIALAPFSSSVKLKNKQFEAATGMQQSSYKGCVVERAGPENYTDAAPSAGNYVTPLEVVDDKRGCEDSREVHPLTTKKSDLKKAVKDFETGGGTAGHLGTAWAWYLLSPAWAGMFETDEKPAPYSDLSAMKAGGGPKLRKIAVLMTDGEYNTAYLGDSSTTQARAICQNMKATGIEVYTVGFEVGGSATVIETLKGCATSESHFYNAESGGALRAAFMDIALKASALRISR